ncbi:LIM domain kinase 1 [Zerene cesonia]|uniref:LIM domain kinase 1 n=1 Tax=Zerene cesonia TaxID=33412 RepID=UPI0018E575ED|nr:LIM domain kinase 1 [Zerene cesonia]
MEGFDTKESHSCAGCLNDLGDEDYVSALGQDWHKDCFRCSVCDAQLTTWYFEKGGLLFCQADYWARFGDICQQCSEIITGPVMAAGEHRFHPECFACEACGAHMDDTATYALLDRSHLYCGACYARGSGGPGGSGGSGAERHAIRVVRLPARALRLASARGALSIAHERCAGKLSALVRSLLRAALQACVHLTCHRIDSSCGMLTLHIGDRVLEVNGSPVRNRPLAEIERVLARPDVIQLTIEHNPDTINAKRGVSTISDDKLKHDSKSPVERKIKEDLKVPKKQSEEEGVKKERLFKRKGEEGGKVRVMKRRQTPASPLLGDKERSSSMSKLLDVVDGEESSGVLCDLSRARSFRAEPAPGQKVFRASDLLQGELLGTGFFGHVYKVTHRATNEVMVLKQLYRVDEEAQRNFLKEVAVLRSLRHRNVLRFVGVLYRDRRLHLVTEYVAGGTLHDLLQNTSRPLSWCARARLARDVAAGLGYLHRMNVIHRDLNSHNCLVRADQDMTVIVADFGLARVVQRTASSTASSAAPHASLRRKRYTVVGNPYWMAPEMMNGNLYDEKVDVFSFGIILCEIIGRVSADPDFLPRRSDFGLNEAQFLDKFCRTCPEPFYRIAFLACKLEPDDRPPFEVMEIWLESLVLQLSQPAPLPGTLLADVERYARTTAAPERRAHTDGGVFCANTRTRTRRSREDLCEAAAGERAGWSALGKCVSAGQVCAGAAGLGAGGAGRARSRSHHALAPGYILRADGPRIDITKVDDISEWLDPPPLKRTSPDSHLNNLLNDTKTRKLEDTNLPAFLRNQSVEGLETDQKEHDHRLPFCRHQSIPDHCEIQTDNETDSSDDELEIRIDCNPKILTDIVKKGNLLAKKASYDITDSPDNLEELIPVKEEIPKTVDKCEKNSLAKKLLSPKLSRLFKPNTTEVVRQREEDKEKSRSKFFVQRPASPIRSTYRVRPAGDEPKISRDVIKSDLKLASLGKPMTPIFRRHLADRQDFDCRYSYRDKTQDKLDRRKIEPPTRKAQNLTPLLEKKDDKPKRREGITRSNYVRLANLKISKELKPEGEVKGSPVERVI